jgi:hypothetical protein
MPFQRLFIIEGGFCGEVPVEAEWIHNVLIPPQSYLFFCLTCGKDFARSPVYKPDGECTEWQSIRGYCRKHAPSYLSMFQVPGSIWLSWDQKFTESFPEPVIRWEFNRHLEHFEKLGVLT